MVLEPRGSKKDDSSLYANSKSTELSCSVDQPAAAGHILQPRSKTIRTETARRVQITIYIA